MRLWENTDKIDDEDAVFSELIFNNDQKNSETEQN
jgi:hypothetical protein